MRYTSAEQRYAAAELSEKIKQYPEAECRYHSAERWYPKHGILISLHMEILKLMTLRKLRLFGAFALQILAVCGIIIE